MINEKWDQRFLRLAQVWASYSKNPGHHVGCLIVDTNRNQLSSGYNGFPRGMKDDERVLDREFKLKVAVHAEANAIATAARNGHPLSGGILYCTHRPCCQCAALIVQAGIYRVVTPKGGNEERWKDEFDTAEGILHEAGVQTAQIELKGLDFE